MSILARFGHTRAIKADKIEDPFQVSIRPRAEDFKHLPACLLGVAMVWALIILAWALGLPA